MKKGVYELLGVAAPFDRSFSLVTSPFLPPLAFALLRLSLAFYGTFFVLFRLVYEGVKFHSDASFFSYFTDLSYIGLLSYFWAAGVQTLCFARSLRSPSPRYPLQAWPRPLQFLHMLLLSTVTTFPVLVTAVFWSLLSSPDTLATRYSAWANLSEHALNTAFAGFEIFFTNIAPVRGNGALPWIHLPFLIGLLACYLGVAYITSGTQHFYPYSFLDPHTQHAKLAAYIVGIAAAEVVLFVLVRYAMLARHALVRRFAAPSPYENADFAESADSSEKGTGRRDVERLEDWEDLGRPSLGSGERGVAL